MAKGSGEVGRKGRERPTATVPVKRKLGVGPGVGRTGTGVIRGIKKKSQPRPDLVWNDPKDETLLRNEERIKKPEQGKHAENYSKAFKKIDKVHRIPANVNPSQLRSVSNPRSSTHGTHYYNEFIDTDPKTKKRTVRQFSDMEINTAPGQVSDKSKQASERATTYHEYGHFYDSQSNKEKVVIRNTQVDDQHHKRRFDSENAFETIKKEGGDLTPKEGDSEMVTWGKAVQRSKSYKDLQKKRAKAKDSRTRKHLDYLLEPRETFARSYAQYISEKADPGAMKATRERYNKYSDTDKKEIGYHQWRGKDFKDTSSAMGNIFKTRKQAVGKMQVPGGKSYEVTVGRPPESIAPQAIPESPASGKPYPQPTTRSLTNG